MLNASVRATTPSRPTGTELGLGGIVEEDEEEEEEFDVNDVPQAFSHFSYESSRGARSLCVTCRAFGTPLMASC